MWMEYSTLGIPHVEKFVMRWVNDLPLLLEIHVPRWIQADDSEAVSRSLHTFADASKKAYATALFSI